MPDIREAIDNAFRDISELDGFYRDDETVVVTVSQDDFNVILTRAFEQFAAAHIAAQAEAGQCAHHLWVWRCAHCGASHTHVAAQALSPLK